MGSGSESAGTVSSDNKSCNKCTEPGHDSPCSCTAHTERKKVGKDNECEQRRSLASDDLRLAWASFNRALRSPEPFDQFHWIRVLGAASMRYLYHASGLGLFLKQLNTRNILRPIVPFFGIGLVVLVVASYFLTLRDSIVLRRWCECSRFQVGVENDSSGKECEGTEQRGCFWIIVHDSTVIYLAVMILWNFVRTTFVSPGVVVPPNITLFPHSGNDNGLTERADERAGTAKVEVASNPRWACVDGRGGCCFIDSVLDTAAEQKVVSLYGKLDAARDKHEGDRNAVATEAKYYPSPEVTYCIKCDQFRPPRCHHCNKCNRCILQYDHHCPWVNNCIGYGNYRLFLLTVFYLAIGCCYGVGLLAGDFYDTMAGQFRQHGFKILLANKTGLLDLPPPWVLWEQATTTGIDPDVIVRMIFPLLFLVGLVLVFFLISHMRYIAAGYTTLEQTVVLSMKLAYRKAQLSGTSHEGNDSVPTNPFHQGWRANFVRILGPIHLLFLPVPATPPLPFVPKDKVA